MAKETFAYTTGKTVIAHFFDRATGYVFVTNGSSSAALVDANWATYRVPLVEQGTASGSYVLSKPAGLSDTVVYDVLLYEEVGQTPTTDLLIGQGEFGPRADSLAADIAAAKASADSAASQTLASALRAALGLADDDLDDQLDAILAASAGGGTVGPGSIEWELTINDTDGDPIGGVEVWITTDEEGDDTIAGTLTTDNFGKVRFMLDAGTYYVWQQRSGYDFSNPTTTTVA